MRISFSPRLLSLFAATVLAGAVVCATDSAVAQTVVKLSDRTILIRGEQYTIHTVRKEETLYAIAKAYGVTQEDIMRANSLTKDGVRNKQTLLIPRHDTTTGTAATPATGTTTVVPEHIRQQQTQTPQTPAPQTPQTQAHRNPQPPPTPAHQNPQTTQTPALQTPDLQTTVKQIKIEGAGVETNRMNNDTASGKKTGRLRELDPRAPISIAVLLPLQSGMSSNDKFSSFYKGVLMGLNALKTEGISANVRFLNSGASAEKTQDMIRSGRLKDVNLIIGPVYPEAFDPVAEYAATELGGVPVVSPLGEVGARENPYVYEAAPDKGKTYDHILQDFSGKPGTVSAGANLVVIDHEKYADTPVLAQIEETLGDNVSVVSFSSEHTQKQAMTGRLNAALDKDRENIVYVPVGKEAALEGVLTHLSSVSSLGKYRVTVIGTPAWGWLGNLNLELLFKLNAHYPASYHADRSDPAVAEFIREYIDSFGEVPGPYAYRGYDVIRYFGGALKRFGADAPAQIAGGGYDPRMLQVGYDYQQTQQGGKYVNAAWPVIHYKPDYTIQVQR